jgi:hypothetical protein
MGANQPAIPGNLVLKSIAPMGRSYGHFAPKTTVMSGEGLSDATNNGQP